MTLANQDPQAPPPANWYPDPEAPGQERLFDGVKWTDSRRRARRSFAAPYANTGLAIGLLIAGIVFALGVVTIPIGAGLIIWVVYLFRGEGENPAIAAGRAQRQLAAESAFHQAVERLAHAREGGAGLVAYRNVGETASRAYGLAGPQFAADAVASIGVDPSRLVSPHIGNLAVLGAGVWLELFREWVIMGQEAHDIDEHTRISVFLDGAIQVVPRQVQKGNALVTVNEQHDMRKAEVQIVSDNWSLRAPINPNDVNEARRMADQLSAHVARLKPAALSSADIKGMVDAILSNSGQPPAEKLKQISNLRYDRLLSDAEFQQAKERILGIGAHFEE